MLQEIANVEQANWWDASEGDHWTEYEDWYNAAPAHHYRRMLAAAAIARPDRVLDIGCGCGQSTRDAARAASAGSAFGIDLSSRMLERARERAQAEGLANVTFEKGDAQVYPLPKDEFDKAISRFGSMFFVDPISAFTNIRRALRPDGRLFLLTWQGLSENYWLQQLRAALSDGRDLPGEPVNVPGPFGLAETRGSRRILEAAGFKDVSFEDVREPMCLGKNTDDAFRMLSGMGLVRGLSKDLDESGKKRVLKNLRATLAAHETAEGVLMDSAAWLITARRA